MSQQAIALKEKEVNALKEKIKKAKSVVIVDYRGLRVGEDTELEYVVLDKNVIAKRRSRLIGNENYQLVVGKGGMV